MHSRAVRLRWSSMTDVQVPILFATKSPDGLVGLIGSTVLGLEPAAPSAPDAPLPRLWADFAQSFITAKAVVASLLAGQDGHTGIVKTGLIELSLLHLDTAGAVGDVVSGKSAGFPMVLGAFAWAKAREGDPALLTRVSTLYATGAIEADGTAKLLAAPESTAAKLQQVVKQPHATSVFLVSGEDRGPAPDPLEVEEVSDANQLVIAALGAHIDEDRVAPSALESVFWGDRDLALGFGSYMAACIHRGSREVRALDDLWLSLDDAADIAATNMISGARELRELAGFAHTLRRQPFASSLVNAGVSSREVVDLNAFFFALSQQPPERDAEDDAHLLAAQRELYLAWDDIREYVAASNHSPRDVEAGWDDIDRQLLSMFARVNRPYVTSAGSITTLDAMQEGASLVSASLGGAWLVKYAKHAFRRGEGRAMDDAHPELDDAFQGKVEEDDYDKLVGGLAQGSRDNRFFSLVLERPFHPRVLWEVLTRENIRYPAEKTLMHDWFRHLEQIHPGILFFWNWEPLPYVGEVRKSNRVYPEPNAFFDYQTPLCGWSGLQDYAAVARTNFANWWMVWDAEPVVASLPEKSGAIEPPWTGELGEVNWPQVEPADGAEWVGRLLNVRSSLARMNAALLQQKRLNQLLASPDDEGIDLFSFRWIGGPPGPAGPTGPRNDALAAMEYRLRGEVSEAGTTRFRPCGSLPSFGNPYSWVDCGLATNWAYDATIAVVLLETLERLETYYSAPERKGDPKGRDARVARFEVARYLRLHYRAELHAMLRVLGRVAGELHSPRPQIDEARWRLHDVARYLDQRFGPAGADTRGRNE